METGGDGQWLIFQSTPPARGATYPYVFDALYPIISIHAPREGGDRLPALASTAAKLFQSTPPREGGDGRFLFHCSAALIFQSTPPARGATGGGPGRRALQRPFQSTPPARGATPAWIRSSPGSIFQSTPPARGATRHRHHLQRRRRFSISIHAPREGGDECQPLP